MSVIGASPARLEVDAGQQRGMAEPGQKPSLRFQLGRVDVDAVRVGGMAAWSRSTRRPVAVSSSATVK